MHLGGVISTLCFLFCFIFFEVLEANTTFFRFWPRNQHHINQFNMETRWHPVCVEHTTYYISIRISYGFKCIGSISRSAEEEIAEEDSGTYFFILMERPAWTPQHLQTDASADKGRFPKYKHITFRITWFWSLIVFWSLVALNKIWGLLEADEGLQGSMLKESGLALKGENSKASNQLVSLHSSCLWGLRELQVLEEMESVPWNFQTLFYTYSPFFLNSTDNSDKSLIIPYNTCGHFVLENLRVFASFARCDTTLYNLIQKMSFTEPEAAFAIDAVLRALAHIHHVRVVHRDLAVGMNDSHR